MLPEDQQLKQNQRKDIADRVTRFIDAHDEITRKTVARELGIKESTVSEVLNLTYKASTVDKLLARMHNWMELAARRHNIIHDRQFVDITVAQEILQVAGMVTDTCAMGAVYGPARIGKTFTLEAIVDEQRYGDPKLVRVTEALLRPFALCREIAYLLGLGASGTFDVVFRRVVVTLSNTKKMLMFDEVERASYRTLEMIRDLHDKTGCPILLCGKPAIYQKLGFRQAGDFSEVTDQLAGRIIVHRDLTERTRGDNPEPLYTTEDIRKLINRSELKLHVDKGAQKWLQARAGSLGMGGIGNAMICLYLASNLAANSGRDTVTASDLDEVADATKGAEDAERLAQIAANNPGMRRVV